MLQQANNFGHLQDHLNVRVFLSGPPANTLYRKMSFDPLKDLQAWYEAQCDGQWEHQRGVLKAEEAGCCSSTLLL